MSKIQQHIDQAILALEKAYAPYSNFQVGASLALTNGQYIHGCNVENCSYNCGMCAERTALLSAYSQRYRKADIKALAVVAKTPTAVTPCGACRQVMVELLELDCPVILSNIEKSDIIETNVKSLMPYLFDNQVLNSKK